jgi:hypothetical protein
MHVAIALVTYNALVYLAPIGAMRPEPPGRSRSRDDVDLPEHRSLGERIGLHRRGAIVNVTTEVTH